MKHAATMRVLAPTQIDYNLPAALVTCTFEIRLELECLERVFSAEFKHLPSSFAVIPVIGHCVFSAESTLLSLSFAVIPVIGNS